MTKKRNGKRKTKKLDLGQMSQASKRAKLRRMKESEEIYNIRKERYEKSLASSLNTDPLDILKVNKISNSNDPIQVVVRTPAEFTSMCNSNNNEKKSNFEKLNTCSIKRKKSDNEILNNDHLYAQSGKRAKFHSEEVIDLLGSENGNTSISKSSESKKTNNDMKFMNIIAVKPHSTGNENECLLKDNSMKSTKEHPPKTHAWRIVDDDIQIKSEMDIPTKSSEFQEKSDRNRTLPTRVIVVKHLSTVNDSSVKIIKGNKSLLTKKPTSHAWRFDDDDDLEKSDAEIQEKSPESQEKSNNERKSPIKIIDVKTQQTNKKSPLKLVKQTPLQASKKKKHQLQSHAWRFDNEDVKEPIEKSPILEPAHNPLPYINNDLQASSKESEIESDTQNFIEVPSLSSERTQSESFSGNCNNGQETCNEKDPLSL